MSLWLETYMQALKRVEADWGVPDLCREMAKEVVSRRGATLWLACQVFTVSQSCFRYEAKTDEETNALPCGCCA